MTKSYNDPFYHVDYNAISDANDGNGVVSGLIVTERGAGQNMSIDVAAGAALISWIKYTEASTINLGISGSHATLPRRDTIIYDASASNPAVLTGTPASEPIPPNTTSGDILLAVVNVPAGATVITNTNIDDGRMMVQDYHALQHANDGNDQIIFYDMHLENQTIDDNTAQKTVTAGTYTKYKETKINTCSAYLNISLAQYCWSDPGNIYTKVYRNGVAVGVEHTSSGYSGTAGWVTWTEIISGWSDGDLLQIYAYTTAGGPVYVKYLKILGANITLQKPISSFVHQDP